MKTTQAGKDKAGIPPIDMPEYIAPEKPEWLSMPARHQWDKVIGQLIESGRISGIDSMALAAYCEYAAEFASNPAEFPSSKMTQFRLLMTDFGMTPSARAKTKFGNDKPKNSSPWDEFKH